MSAHDERPEFRPAQDDEAWLDEIGSKAGAAIRRPAPPMGLDALRRRQRNRMITRAAGGAAGVVVLMVGALLWVSRDDSADRPVVGPDPSTIEVPSTTEVRTEVSNPTSTIVAPTTIDAPTSIVDGVRALSPLASFALPLDDPNQTEFAFTPDGVRLIARAGTADWAILDGETGDEIRRLPTDYGTEVTGVAYGVHISSDGTRFTDGRTLWDLGTGAVVNIVSDLDRGSYATSARQHQVGGDDSMRFGLRHRVRRRFGRATVRAAEWRDTGRPAFSLDSSELVMSAPDGKTGDWPIQIFDAASGTLKRTIPAQLFGNADFVSGGDRLLLSGVGLEFFDYSTGDSAPLFANPSYGPAVVSPDGARVILDSVASTDPARPYFAGYSKSVLDTSTGQVVAEPGAAFHRPSGSLAVLA